MAYRDYTTRILSTSPLTQGKKLLLAGNTPAEVSNQCGFSDQSHFTRHFKQALGVTPGNFIRHRIGEKSNFILSTNI
ncbi:TPA: helix-turn-helix domain-containing protein [Providencia rettgeri]